MMNMGDFDLAFQYKKKNQVYIIQWFQLQYRDDHLQGFFFFFVYFTIAL